MLTDMVALYLAFVGAYALRTLNPLPPMQHVSLIDFGFLVACLVPVWILVFAVCGLYTTRPGQGRTAEVGRVFAAVLVVVMGLIVVDYMNGGLPLFTGRTVPVYVLILGFIAVLLGRCVLRWVMHLAHLRGRGLHRVIIVGTGPLAERIVTSLQTRGSGNEVVAAVSSIDAGALLNDRIPVYATVQQALEGHRVHIDEIINAEPGMPRSEAVALMQLASSSGIGYRFVPDLYGVFAASSTMSTVSGVPVMEIRLTSLHGWSTVGKRVADVLGSAVGLFLLAPLFAVVAVLVKLNDPAGPIFYRQERVGRGGVPIGIFKFRSMLWEYSTGPDRPYKTAAEAFRAMGRADLCAEFELEQKVADDPRVSRFGLFLRRTSLDELPQLLNSLLGHISLVGPRPITPAELERYGQHQSSFLALKPGITGLWQVSGRSSTGYDERVKLDVFYAENWTTWLDLSILARTVVTVAARRGAY